MWPTPITVHPLAYTAREVAAAEHPPAPELAKVVVLAAESGYRMVVLPASQAVDFQELHGILGFSRAVFNAGTHRDVIHMPGRFPEAG